MTHNVFHHTREYLKVCVKVTINITICMKSDKYGVNNDRLLKAEVRVTHNVFITFATKIVRLCYELCK